MVVIPMRAKRAREIELPTVPASHFIIDLPTLFPPVFLSATGGLLLIFPGCRTVAPRRWLRGASAISWIFDGGATRGVCADAEVVVGLPRELALLWCLRDDVGGHTFIRRPARPCRLVGAGAAIWFSAFQFESFAASPSAWVVLVWAIAGDLRASERARALVRAGPRAALALANDGAGRLARGFSFRAYTVCRCIGDIREHRAAARRDCHGGGFSGAVHNLLPAGSARCHVQGTRRAGAKKGGADDSLTGVANRRAFFIAASRW